MPLNPACAALEALTDAVRPDAATGITDEANTPNCLCVIPRRDPNFGCHFISLSSVSTPSFARAAPVAGQLAHIQEHQNIVRTTLCAPATLLSKLTFKSKMESSPLLPSPASPSSCPLGELIKP